MSDILPIPDGLVNPKPKRKLWPTPMAGDRSTGSPAELQRRSPTLKALARSGQLEPVHPRGLLIPEFIEWMMGFPIGWTANV